MACRMQLSPEEVIGAQETRKKLSEVYYLLDEIRLEKKCFTSLEFKMAKYPKQSMIEQDWRKSNGEILDEETARLCEKLSKLSPSQISEYSLEMQLWWKVHQEADKNRLEREKKDKQNALSKLTEDEKKLLEL